MKRRHRVALASVVVVVLLWLAAAPVLAHSGTTSLDLAAVTESYLVTLRLGPPGRTIAVDEVEVAGVLAGGEVVLCTTDTTDETGESLASGTHHLEVHIVDRLRWRVVDKADVAIALRHEFTGLRATLPAVRMVNPDRGVDDVHFGGEVFTPDARYHVTVTVNGEVAEFDFLARAGGIEAPPNLGTVLVGRGIAPGLLVLFSLGAFVVLYQSLTGGWRPADAAHARLLFVGLLLFQGFHEFEHVVQVVQAFVLGVRGAAGLGGSIFGLEPVHFAYNAWFLALVGAVFMAFALGRAAPIARPRAVYALLGLALVLQSYHVIEHVAKMSQYLSSGLNGVPGLLGVQYHPIWLHFWLNTAAYVPCVAAFFVGGLHRDVTVHVSSTVAGVRKRRLEPTQL